MKSSKETELQAPGQPSAFADVRGLVGHIQPAAEFLGRFKGRISIFVRAVVSGKFKETLAGLMEVQGDAIIAQEALSAQQQLKATRFQNAGRTAEYQLKSYRKFLLDQQKAAGGNGETLEGWRATQMELFEARTVADLQTLSPTGNEQTNYAMASFALQMAIGQVDQPQLPAPSDGAKTDSKVVTAEFKNPPYKPDEELGAILEHVGQRRDGYSSNGSRSHQDD